jgi:hypothetical protein
MVFRKNRHSKPENVPHEKWTKAYSNWQTGMERSISDQELVCGTTL